MYVGDELNLPSDEDGFARAVTWGCVHNGGLVVGGWVGTEDRGDYLGSYRPELQLRITGRTEVLLLGGGLREWAGLGFVGNSSSSRGPIRGSQGVK